MPGTSSFLSNLRFLARQVLAFSDLESNLTRLLLLRGYDNEKIIACDST